jgi:hypothetical protein
MKRTALALALIAAAMLPGSATAQAIELKNTRLGMTMPEVVAIYPGLQCLATACYFARSSRLRDGKTPPVELMRLAGATVGEWWFYFDGENRLFRQTIKLSPVAIVPIVAGLTEKYGEPKSKEESEFQSVGGAKVTQTSATWEIGDSRLRAVSPSGKITEMTVRLSSIKRDAEDVEKAKARAKTDL